MTNSPTACLRALVFACGSWDFWEEAIAYARQLWRWELVRLPDRRFGEIVFLLKPGWLIARSGFENPRWVPIGMHGYHSDDRYSDACFLSDREPPVELQTIIDVYDCMYNAAFRRHAARK